MTRSWWASIASRGAALSAGLLVLGGCAVEIIEPGADRSAAPAEEQVSSLPADPSERAVPAPSELGLTRDYLMPPEDGGPSPFALLRDLPDGTTVTYVAFDSASYSLRQFNGKHTALLLSQALLDEVGLARVRQIIDDADLLYKTKAEITGAEPPGTGLLRIAVVDVTCGYGCGYVNAKGIEIVPDAVRGESGINVINHELNHNFDSLSPFLFTNADSAHAWTEVLDDPTHVYLERGGSPRGNGQALTNPEFMTFKRKERLNPYEEFPGASWQTCIANQACDPAGGWSAQSLSVHTQSGIALRVFELFGVKQPLRTWVQQARSLVQSRGYVWDSFTPEQRREFLLETLSLGVQANLSCFYDAWNWPVSTSLRASLTAQFGATNPYCSDADADGFTRQKGDCNDTNAAIKPSAVETVNNVDDNCNGVKDDVLVQESGDFPNDQSAAQAVGFPARIRGSSGGDDWDHFSITLASTTTVRFQLRSLDTYAAWFDVYNQSAPGSLDAFWIWSGDVNVSKVTLGPGTWKFSVWGADAGNYELIVQPDTTFPVTVPDLWPISWTPDAVSNPSANQYVFPAQSVPGALASVPGLQVRHWVSGYGWVGTTGAGTSFTWSAPAGTDPQELVYRSQFVSSSVLPVWPLSQHRNVSALSWTSQDVGAPAAPGSTSRWVDNFAIEGSGAGITGTADAFRFSWVKVNGDATIVARVVSLENTSASALAGVTIRETLNTNAKHATVAVTPSSTIRFQRRTSSGGSTSSSTATQSETAPRWLKLQRTGSTFQVYRSNDGASWTSVGSATISMSSTVYVGVAATSASGSLTGTAQVDDVAVTGTIVP
ncbi:MopE-related protein [Sorangium sp. So ce1151]|uniref:MopE-related protein n=1 Tax=Sorangium sp. So ce1151 TaxID=3133332 RepID=UPI003F5DAFD7